MWIPVWIPHGVLQHKESGQVPTHVKELQSDPRPGHRVLEGGHREVDQREQAVDVAKVEGGEGHMRLDVVNETFLHFLLLGHVDVDTVPFLDDDKCPVV